jgi:hypothetical protein
VGSQGPNVYSIRIAGHLGTSTLAAFPEMAAQQQSNDCILTGTLPDCSALFGIVAQIEALSLELIEIRRLES